jgi:hypothetical protein
MAGAKLPRIKLHYPPPFILRYEVFFYTGDNSVVSHPHGGWLASHVMSNLHEAPPFHRPQIYQVLLFFRQRTYYLHDFRVPHIGRRQLASLRTILQRNHPLLFAAFSGDEIRPYAFAGSGAIGGVYFDAALCGDPEFDLYLLGQVFCIVNAAAKPQKKAQYPFASPHIVSASSNNRAFNKPPYCSHAQAKGCVWPGAP